MTKTTFAQSLSGRLLLLGVLPAMLAISAIVALGTIDSYRNLRRSEEQVMAANAVGGAVLLNTRNERWNGVASLLALAQSNGMFGKRKESSDLTHTTTEVFTGIIGAWLSYEPNADGQDAASLKSGELPPAAMTSTGR